ncbi:class F sortase [Amycolatopsis alkalitolerans]|uniref:Class F sortase n=1 Tax=Amycolatopsis alkalitolerans TaxID=2547244 RepID=A0A5C4LTG3_9PSEU|nr:class F sortase [Amycolatopsis alkalitolerans]TNC22358.1 class F sortase [Amycolatopsis alkalitolerans]
MSFPPRRRWPALLAIGAALVACGPAPQTPQPEPPTTTQVLTQPAPVTAGARPATLEIPAIGVHTGQIIDLGLTSAGELEVPKDARTTGWYTGSPAPGDVGPAVLAAHVDYNHVPGTFYRLKDLRAGDQAIVRRADGSSVVFTVYRVAHYPKSAFPTDEVYGDTAGPELRLITCGGTFDRATRNYEDNIVAYARLKSPG